MSDKSSPAQERKETSGQMQESNHSDERSQESLPDTEVPNTGVWKGKLS
jgi:hypothetical protein